MPYKTDTYPSWRTPRFTSTSTHPITAEIIDYTSENGVASLSDCHIFQGKNEIRLKRWYWRGGCDERGKKKMKKRL